MLRARKLPSLPSTVEEELQYNMQLRASPRELALLCGCEPCEEIVDDTKQA